MKKLCIITCLLLVVSCNNNTSKTSISDAVVQDYNDLFTATEEQKLSEKIINYEKLTTNQICIYTIDSIPNNEKILYHATTLAQKLGVGIKEKDNGLLILISYYDRDMAIATGYGVEKVITDSIAKTIIKQTIVPRFKDSLYFEGVTIGLDSIISKWK